MTQLPSTRTRISKNIYSFNIGVLLITQTISTSMATNLSIADIPMAVKNAAKPNIMFILDNSGSMSWGSITGLDATAQYSNSYIDYYYSKINRLYYDPNTTYPPPVNADGTSMGNVSPTNAPNDPYTSGSGNLDLTTSCYMKSSAASAPGLPISPSSTGSCRTSSNSTYNTAVKAYAFYNTCSQTTPSSSTSYSTCTRTEINSGTASYTGRPNRTDCANAPTCTYAEEIQNFANWYSYYRTRIQTMKTAMGRAFAALDNNYRVGFSTINDNSSNTNSNAANFINISDFNQTQKNSWYSTLYSIDPGGGTPLQSALQKAGNYYQNGKMGYTSKYDTSVDPVQYSCQQNYAILSTDGYWNGSYNSTGDIDGAKVPTLPTSALNPAPDPGLTAAQNWPRPYYDSSAVKDTLADVAAYYWVTDLRTSGSTATNNVPVTTSDPASWQHMTTFTIGLGANGSQPYQSDYLTATSGFYYNLTQGTANWPKPVADTATTIEDLWHTAVNGHGQYFSAADPATIQSSLIKVLNNIVDRASAAAAVTVSNPNIVSGDNIVYQSSYSPGNWTGDLAAYPVDLTTGNLVLTTPVWTSSPQTQLDSRTSANRSIVTYSGSSGTGQGRQFQPTSASTTTKLSSAQQTLLNSSVTPPGPADGSAVVAYLRGDRSQENLTTGGYRTRAHLLGDIINAEPLLVRPPIANYIDNCYSNTVSGQCTQSFRNAQANRTRVLFQGANDGMMHAFTASSGAESWAYIPNLVMSSLNLLTLKTGFGHHYYVDGVGSVGDVDFANTSGGSGNPDWHTILASGLGKGGRGFFALDVTTPTATSEADAASKVLWEFPNSSTNTVVKNNVGYSYGRPLITKTAAAGWVVLVTSGYNNGTGDSGGDGHGYLFVLNARTGDLIRALDTGVGSSTTPSGLAKISGYVENVDVDNTVQYVYGGDLQGNVWRFDLTNSDSSQWSVVKLATLVDNSNNPQPVTTEPELGEITLAGVSKRFVYVGTGQYLGDLDIPGASGAYASATSTQSMYGLIDDLSTPSGTNAVISPLRSNLQRQTLTVSTSNSTQRVSSNITPNYATQKGWYIDLPSTGERINTSPGLSQGTLVFTSNIPSSDVCSPGGTSWFNAVNYQTGGAVAGNTWASISLGNFLASTATLFRLGNGQGKAAIRTSGGGTVTQNIPVAPGSGVAQRISWREIIQQ